MEKEIKVPDWCIEPEQIAAYKSNAKGGIKQELTWKPLPRESSNLTQYAFDTIQFEASVKGKTKTSVRHVLYLEFRGKARYAYKNVPTRVIEELLAAESHGKYFAAEIKDNYVAIKL